MHIPQEYPLTIINEAVRQNEEVKHWFRMDRVFLVENQWYFTTRDDRDVGPFRSRADADIGVQLFLDSLSQGNDINSAVSVAVMGNWAVTKFR